MRSRRTRILFWLGTAAVVVVGGLIAAHAIWSWRSGATLEKLLAQLEAAGEPMTVASLEVDPIPDHLNGYSDIRAAMAALPPESKEKLEERLAINVPPPLFDDERALLLELTGGGKAALAALAPAVAKPHVVNDQLRYPKPALSVLLPDLASLRRLAAHSVRSAIVEFDAGRHDRAMQDLRLIDPVARGAASHRFLVGALVAIGCRAMEVDQVTAFAPQLRIGAGPGEVPPAEVERWIKELLNDGVLRKEFVDALRGERVIMLDAMRSFSEGEIDASVALSRSGGAMPPSGYLARPILRQNAYFAADYMTRVIEILNSKETTDWSTANARLAPLEKEMQDKVLSWRYMFARALLPSVSRFEMTAFRAITVRRCAATALAVRWYQVDHNGALPATLGDLVPKYLPAVPLDPFAAGKPLNYRAGDDAVVWSVGDNGVDDGGSEAPTPGQGSRDAAPATKSWTSKDFVVPLVVRPREKSWVTSK